jgi:hypothetical protein
VGAAATIHITRKGDIMNGKSIVPQNHPTTEVGTREWYRMIGRRGGRARAAMPDFRDHIEMAQGYVYQTLARMVKEGKLVKKGYQKPYGRP